MKIKKLLLLVSMLAVMFSLAGCDENKEKPFDYDEKEIVLNTMSSFLTYSNISDDYVDYYVESGTAFEKSAIDGIKQAKNTDKVGEFEDYSVYAEAVNNNTFSVDMVDADIVNEDDYVSVSIINKAEERDIKITVKYVENADYYMMYNELSAQINESTVYQALLNEYYSTGTDPNVILASYGFNDLQEFVEYQKQQTLMQQGVYKYIPEEMVVAAIYSTGELMKQAGLNTLLGMGTVFVVLIFISFIISLMKYLPALFARKSEDEKKEADKPVQNIAKNAPEEKNLVDDSELAAVITAAIYASAGCTGAGSKDTLVVRSIKRVKR